MRQRPAAEGCYLGEGANKSPAQSVEALKSQMRALRPALGSAGNLQLTDGDVTLRPVEGDWAPAVCSHA